MYIGGITMINLIISMLLMTCLGIVCVYTSNMNIV